MGNVNENRLNLTYSAADIALMKANANSTISKVPAGATLTPEEREREPKRH
jgi:tRNA threonylcarbamoyladenosine modification (KEOPS) complex  Pcc1 subunit